MSASVLITTDLSTLQVDGRKKEIISRSNSRHNAAGTVIFSTFIGFRLVALFFNLIAEAVLKRWLRPVYFEYRLKKTSRGQTLASKPWLRCRVDQRAI